MADQGLPEPGGTISHGYRPEGLVVQANTDVSVTYQGHRAQNMREELFR